MNSIILGNWKFHYNDCPDAWYKGYADDTWEDVTVPHDWSVHMPFSKEYSSGTGYLAGGIGWYRTSFKLPESLNGKRISIVFDGVYKNCQVWYNSYYLGKRPFGYSAFCYDITEQASFGDIPNVIAVKVDHRDFADSRWFTGSGITRKVTVLIEESIRPEHCGIFFKTPEVSCEKADIEITNSIVNDSPHEVIAVVENRLFYEGSNVLSLKSTCQLPSGSSTIVENIGSLASPHLWSPDSPKLYELRTIIHSKTADKSFECSEETVQSVGIRSFLFDPDNGFFLNGRELKLNGVCVHDDAGCLGSAVLPEVWVRRLYNLKEMGCNAIRMSHNPHMPELYDLCDSMGFIVMDEAFDEWEGAKNKWTTGHNVYPPKHQGYFEDFPEWHERDLADLIKRNRNHPSILLWSVGNEIDYPNDPYCHPLFTSMTGNNDKNKPATERQYNTNKPNAERLSVIIKELVDIVKKHDATRPVTAAVAFPELSTQIGYIDPLDVVGYNYKEQFYLEDHLRFPEKPFLGSENSHSYKAWKAVRDCKYISGQFLWTGIDYLGEAHGWPIHGSGAGLLTLAGFPKTSYYFRKSLWSKDPMVYLVTARADLDKKENAKKHYREWKPMDRSWNYIPGELIEIRCYTNLHGAELYCNDKPQGRKVFDDETGYISWVIPFEAGEIRAVGYNASDASTAATEDILTSTGPACDIRLFIWDSESLGLPYPRANTLKQIEVTITDAAGSRMANDSTMLYVNVSGSGKLVGLENGDLSDLTEYTASCRRAYEGRLIIYVSCPETEGDTTVSVFGKGLRTASILL